MAACRRTATVLYSYLCNALLYCTATEYCTRSVRVLDSALSTPALRLFARIPPELPLIFFVRPQGDRFSTVQYGVDNPLYHFLISGMDYGGKDKSQLFSDRNVDHMDILFVLYSNKYFVLLSINFYIEMLTFQRY